MSAEQERRPAPRVVQLPEQVFRVGRNSGLVHFSTIRPDDAELPRGGNRYDVPGGGVLYAATQLEACFGETLARFRPSPKMRELLADEGEGNGYMVCGSIPQDWRLQRGIGSLSAPDAAPFLDVESAETMEFLTSELAAELAAIGQEEPLDVPAVRGPDRRLSRLISRYAFTAMDADGGFSYSGIRYLSRVNSEWECWAIFEGTDVETLEERPVELHDPALQSVALMWGLRPF